MAETILVRIKGDEKDFVRATGKAGKATKKFGGGMKALKIGLVAASAALIGMIVTIKKLIDIYGKQERAEANLHAMLKNRITGVNELAEAEKKLIQQAAELQAITIFADEDIIAAQAMFATFPLGVEQIAQLTPRLLDMASAVAKNTGQAPDIQQLAAMMGKAFTGQVGALSRYGVVLSDTAKKTGDFNAILADLDANFRGAAEAAGETGVGALAKFKNALGDMLEPLGKMVLSIVKDMLPSLKRFAKTTMPFLEALMGTTLIAARGIIEVMNLIVQGIQWLLGVKGKLEGEAGEGGTYEEQLRRRRREEGASELERARAGRVVAAAEKQRWQETVKDKEKLIDLAVELRETTAPIPGLERDALKYAEGRLVSAEKQVKAYDKIIKGLTGITIKPLTTTALAGVGKVDTDIIKVGPYAGWNIDDAMADAELMDDWLAERNEELFGREKSYWEQSLVLSEEDLEEIRRKSEEAAEAMEARAKEWVDSVQESLRFLGDTFSGFWDTLFDPMFAKLDEAETAWGKFGASIVKDLFNMLKQVATKVLVQGLALAAIVTMLNAIAPGVGTFLMKILGGIDLEKAEGAAAGGFGGILKSLLGITGKQAGGYVGKRPYIVGERGAELFVPQAPGEIISNEVLNRLASALRPAEAPAGALGSQVTFVMEGDAAEILAAITRIYRQAPRQQQAAFGADVSEHSRDLVESV